jgi:surface antigen/LysM repeat protein
MRSFSNHFPAVQLKHQHDTWDYIFNFSSELLVSGLVLIVAISTFVVFGPLSHDKGHDFSDSSLAARLLAYHTDWNQELYAKQNSIKTVIVKQDSFIATARADNEGVLSSDSANSALSEEDDGSIQDNVIDPPHPDTVRDLLTKQIKIYTTKEGDTLGSIAREHNIDIDTIKWANNLPNNKVAPGWHLKILPTKGVLYQAKASDTLPDIAKYFKGNLDQIIAYNGLENAEDIEPGRWIICPGCVVPPPPPSKTQPKGTSANARATIIAGPYHIFPYGYCTWYAAQRFGGFKGGGNAKQWLATGRAAGYKISDNPTAGSVVFTTDNAQYGHVAYVESVSDGYIHVAEMNYVGFGKINKRSIPISSKTIRGYISK